MVCQFGVRVGTNRAVKFEPFDTVPRTDSDGRTIRLKLPLDTRKKTINKDPKTKKKILFGRRDRKATYPL